MKKVLLFILSIAIVLSTVCIVASADEYIKEEEALRGTTVTVVFAVPGEYANVKSGALVYDFDEVAFELVEGSAKWMLSSWFIKDVNVEKKEAIFAFTGAKTVSGNLFTMTLKVKEDAAFGDYKISAVINLNQGEYMIDALNVISIVEEQVEFDDPTTPADFAAVVGKLEGAAVTEDTYTVIADAVAKYNALTSWEKEEAADDYAKLLVEIEAYNNAADTVNEQAQNTLEVAFSAISGAFAYLSKLLKAFVQMIF